MQNKKVTRYIWWIVEWVQGSIVYTRVYYVYVIDTVNLPSNLLYDILFYGWCRLVQVFFASYYYGVLFLVSSFLLIGKYSMNLNETFVV